MEDVPAGNGEDEIEAGGRGLGGSYRREEVKHGREIEEITRERERERGERNEMSRLKTHSRRGS